MRTQAEHTVSATTAQAGHASGVRLQGRWLVVVRVAWVALVALYLATFATEIPAYDTALQHVCPQTCIFWPSQARALAALGISIQTYAWIVIALASGVVLTALAMALIVFWRRSDDWMALIVAFSLVVFPSGNLSTLTESNTAPSGPLVFALLVLLLSLPAYAAFYGTFLLFPSGRFVPRWSWILLIAWLLFEMATKVQGDAFGGLLDLGYPILYGGAIACQVYRYRSVSSPVQRQQTKLVVVGFIASLLANQLFWQTSRLNALTGTVYGPLVLLVYLLTLLLLPFTLFLAIQRYRLYDIDVLIRRTLIYGSLSFILALVYIGGVIGMQTLLNSIVRSQGAKQLSPPVIVVTTLLIAALFQPLRRRIQRAVDRRFYRSKYDARRAIDAFGASLRQQVDLPTLTSQLVTVVQETMQPEHVSLWLHRREGRPPE